MTLLTPTRVSPDAARSGSGEQWRRLLTSWEIYPILVCAICLRLLSLDTVPFSQDEAAVYEVARMALVHGLLPLTSNRASIGTLNPPGVVYLFMIPALFGGDPIWGEAFVALLNTLAVLLTYLFARRYYGRLAGSIAAALFATSAGAWLYSRNIWPQNLLPFFVIILIWLLYRGVVERKTGWFFPALLVEGLLYQLHGSTLYLICPLIVAVLLAWRTIRWRELILIVAGWLILFAPFLLWEARNGFVDLRAMLSAAQGQVIYDNSALLRYLFFLRPTLSNPYTVPLERIRDSHLIFPDGRSVLLASPLHYSRLLLSGGALLAPLCCLLGVLMVLGQILLAGRSEDGTSMSEKPLTGRLASWWSGLRASPQRQGLLILLAWQMVPLVLMTRHSVPLFDHYFIFFLPGQFILIALLITRGIELVKVYRPAGISVARIVLGALALGLVLAQLIGAAGTMYDMSVGNFDPTSVQPRYSELSSPRNALWSADQLAQQRGIRRISVVANENSVEALTYLGQQLSTPTQVSLVMGGGSARCVILPAASAGPVVLVVEPGAESAAVLEVMQQYTQATLVRTLPTLGGGEGYRLYILSAKAAPEPADENFTRSLRLLSAAGDILPATHQLLTRWQISETQGQGDRTRYLYQIQSRAGSSSANYTCATNATWEGDQLFFLQQLSAQQAAPAWMTVQAQVAVAHPQYWQLGPLTLTSFYASISGAIPLMTNEGRSVLTLPIGGGKAVSASP